MPQTRPAIMAPYLSRFLKTALTNSYRPFPTWLIFRSVAGHFPDIWKEGLVRSKLKITVPSAISHAFQRSLKRSEKAAALQISDHISSNQMPPEFQSAYSKNHSTESALLRMRNDILVKMNRQRVTLLVCLELSAAFDTVDHDILLRRLEYNFGIKDQSLIWFKSSVE